MDNDKLVALGSKPHKLIRRYSSEKLDVPSDSDKESDDSDNENEKILSLDDDDLDEKQQNETSEMLDVVKDQVIEKGWAQVSLALIKEKCSYLVTGYARQKFDTEYILPSAVVDLFRMFYPIAKLNVFCWNNKYLTIGSDGTDPSVYVVKKLDWKLCELVKLLDADSSEILEFTKVPSHTLKDVVVYMAHHKGVKPDKIAKPIRSVHMADIVGDKWDATFIDGMSKKAVFQVILAANYLGIKSLLNLGCAKIAALIKGLSPAEITRALAE